VLSVERKERGSSHYHAQRSPRSATGPIMGISVIPHRVEPFEVTVVFRVAGARAVLVDVPRPVGTATPADLPIAHRARSPVDEHAELGIAKPLHAGVPLFRGFVDLGNQAEIRE